MAPEFRSRCTGCLRQVSANIARYPKLDGDGYEAAVSDGQRHVSKQEQKGTARILGWGALIIMALFLWLMGFFFLAPLPEGSWQTSPFKRTPEQNVGQGNAPADSHPSPACKKIHSGTTSCPTDRAGQLGKAESL
ncbi:conserved hypothetical protein [Mesorhizobium sp. SOD10]|nr:conserved hypothetical protein [Mesorhizobium sp. SOD10]